MSKHGCDFCRPVVVKIAAGGVLGPEARTGAAQHCVHCDTVWAIQVYPLDGDAREDVLGLIAEAQSERASKE